MAAREVVFVGICGASGSGKTSVAKLVGAALHSPVQAIQVDWWFRNRPPKCAKCDRCRETPASVDFNLICMQLDKLRDILSKAQSVPSISLQASDMEFSLHLEDMVDKPLDASAVYVIVEGLLVFADPDLVSFFCHCIWLDIDCLTGSVRRYRREGRPPPEDLSNPIFKWFHEDWYAGHIYQQYEQYRTLQLSVAGDKLRGRIDASKTAEVVAKLAVDCLTTASGSSSPASPAIDGSSEAPLVKGFRYALANKHRFEWSKPDRCHGRTWWLSGQGMHQRWWPKDSEATEFISDIEIVGRCNFVMQHFKDVYMLDETIGHVYVFTGQHNGVSHVSVLAGVQGLDLTYIGGTRHQYPVGYCREGVTPAPTWFAEEWHWDEWYGYEGSWTVTRGKGPSGLIRQTSSWSGSKETLEWDGVFITPTAMVLPDFGLCYLLDDENTTVWVWNGRELCFAAYPASQH
eukprot:TRINITY_DN74413_c0_g1_i1.p1 TRINITY_DN74413_c0_g1~~TRINITY_DN74413_c0_g1_i1.p1  ORF type:complete len:490 (-),score=40.25 TRINITY_DN74413_c0_g1_i1:196-1572(-)